MIARTIYQNLLKWKTRKNRKPLIIRGARQIGKTTIVNQFSKEFDNYLYYNLDDSRDKAIFESITNINELIQALYINRNQKKGVGTTLLFIDEIQESPLVIKQLRYFYEKATDLYVIAAGSLLEHALSEIENYPVGRVSFLMMYPLNFIEYLDALKLNLLQDVLNTIPLPSHSYLALMDQFHKFVIIGGMPEIVAQYAEHQDLGNTQYIYDELILSFQEDVVKYADNGKQSEVIRHIIINAAQEADNRITFANFAHSNYRSEEVKKAMIALEQAKIIQLIYPTNHVSPPIVLNKKNKPRLQYLDTGLMNYALGIQAELLAIKDLNNMYRGKIIQHIVTQELQSTQTSPLYKPSFWVREKKTSNAEVDLLWRYAQYLIPIEVKAGKTGRLRSLMQFMDRCDHPYALRLYHGSLEIHEAKTLEGKSFKLLNLPYFLGCKIPEYVEWFVENN